MKRNLLIISVCFLMFFACKKHDPDNDNDGIVLNTPVSFSLTNSNGDDLFDSETPNYLKAGGIRIYHKINNELVRYNEGHLDYSNGCRLELKGSEYYEIYGKSVFVLLGVRAYGSRETKPITYIHWNDSDIDTVECEIKKSGAITWTDKVWYNGDLVYIYEDGVNYFTFEK